MTRPRLPLPVIGIVLPAIVSIAGILIVLPFLPAHDIVVHWGPDGTPDGYAPAWTFLVGVTAVGLAAPILFGIPIVLSRRDAPSWTLKFLAVAALWLTALTAALSAWTILGQRDASVVPNIAIGLPLAFGVAFLIATLGWFLGPVIVAVAPEGTTVAPLKLGATERAVWVGRTRLATPGIVAIGFGILFSAVAAVLVLIPTRGAVVGVLVVPVVLLVALVMTSFWTVRVDETGLTVRSVVGWPLFRIPAAQVASAGTIRVQALGDFGGWGIRFGRGRRLGIVMRSGEALEVQKRDGSALVVTVDDAAAAASVLGAVAERAARGRP